MGRIVFAAAMSHVLDPDYYERVCGAVGRRKTDEAMAAIAAMGERFSATGADALVVVADDHLNAFSFNCVPAICVRIGRDVPRMRQDHAEAFDAVLEHMPSSYPLHEALANAILEQGTAAGFDLALSWEAPVDHAFLAPVNTMHGTRPIPPLVPIWINCFVAPQPTARRCFAFGQHIARVVARGDWNVGIIATRGGSTSSAAICISCSRFPASPSIRHGTGALASPLLRGAVRTQVLEVADLADGVDHLGRNRHGLQRAVLHDPRVDARGATLTHRGAGHRVLGLTVPVQSLLTDLLEGDRREAEFVAGCGPDDAEVDAGHHG